MTTRTRTPIVCECGHNGFLCRAENDQPHSGLWESYTLESFKGDSLTIDDYRDKPSNVLAHLKPECPECGVIGKVERMKNGQRPQGQKRPADAIGLAADSAKASSSLPPH